MPAPAGSAPPGPGTQPANPILAAAQQALAERVARTINPPPPQQGGGRGQPAAGAVAPFTPRAVIQRAIPQVTTAEAVRMMGGAFAGAAIAALMISKLFPHNRVLTALAVGVGSSILAASSPVTSLAENLGLGGAVMSMGWLVLDVTGQIREPQTQPAGLASPAVPAATRALVLRALT
jgi:hypothetical protein